MSRWIVPEHFKVLIGGNTYIDCPIIIDYKGQSLFELRRSNADGFLGIDFDVYKKDGTKVATIRNGQFVGTVPGGYKIEASFDQYALMDTASNRCVCGIKVRDKAPGDAELEVSAEMYMPDGRLVVLSPTHTNVGSFVVSGCTFKGCGAAIRVN
jgi:hypothetical protein